MSAIPPGPSPYRRLYRALSPAQRRKLFWLAPLVLAGAFAELLSVGAVIPLLYALADPQRLLGWPVIGPLLTQYGLTAGPAIAGAMVGAFTVAILLALAVRLWLLRASTRFAYAFGESLGEMAFRGALHRPYPEHIRSHTAAVISALGNIQYVITGVVLPGLLSIGALVIALFMIAAIMAVDWLAALLAGGTIGLIYGAVAFGVRRFYTRSSQLLRSTQNQRVRMIQEPLGGIRDVILDSAHEHYTSVFAANERILRQAQARVTFRSSSPRLVVEGFGLLVIMGVAVVLAQNYGSIVSALPVLGALALASQRVLPLIQTVYQAWSQAASLRSILTEILDLAELPQSGPAAPSDGALTFHSVLTVKDVSFRYAPDATPALCEVSLMIPRGAMIAITGKTGSGKSTLMDLILGLLHAQSGGVFIDDTMLTPALAPVWQAQVAHVPQSIHLSDASLAENIAFGQPLGRIDMDRVKDAARRAEIAGFIESLPGGYSHMAGERGVRLSGGQRQRIGIARALYKQASVLVLDEATSALDSQTETAVMDSIRRLAGRITVILVTHRPGLAAQCDQEFRLEDGRLTAPAALSAAGASAASH